MPFWLWAVLLYVFVGALLTARWVRLETRKRRVPWAKALWDLRGFALAKVLLWLPIYAVIFWIDYAELTRKRMIGE